MQSFRLAILGSHPIPYRVPLYRLLANRAEIDLQVLYGDDYGLRPRPSAWGVQDFVWKTDIARGYPHVFLKNWSPRPDPSTLMGKMNPDLVFRLYRFNPNAVLATGYTGFFHLQGIAAALARRIPILFLGDNNSLLKQPGGLRGLVKPHLLRRLYRSFSGFLVIGEENRKHYRMFGVPDNKMFDFPYAVDNEYLTREAARLQMQREALRENWDIKNDSVCVVCAGRLAPEKNIEELINAIARLDKLHLLIVGDGPERNTLAALAQRLIPGRHTFAGFLNQDRLSEAYTAADIFALTSRREPWGLVANEAMNFGLPLVLSDQVGCNSDLLIEGKTGWRYSLGDVAALARALENATSAVVDRRDELAQTVRRHVASFNFQNQVEGIIAALHSVLNVDERSRRHVA